MNNPGIKNTTRDGSLLKDDSLPAGGKSAAPTEMNASQSPPINKKGLGFPRGLIVYLGIISSAD